MDAPTAFASLYRDLILEHGRAPRLVGALEPPAHRAVAHNPLCGDRVELSLRLDAAGRIEALRHHTEGCLLCTASASLLAERVLHLDAVEVAALYAALRAAVEGAEPGARLGDVAALCGVAAYPARQRCAALPWEALTAAFDTASEASP